MEVTVVGIDILPEEVIVHADDVIEEIIGLDQVIQEEIDILREEVIVGADEVIEEIIGVGDIILGLDNLTHEEVIGVVNMDGLDDIVEGIHGVHNVIQEEIIGVDDIIVEIVGSDDVGEHIEAGEHEEENIVVTPHQMADEELLANILVIDIRRGQAQLGGPVPDQHHLGPMTAQCTSCHAKHFIQERSSGHFSLCCGNGKIT